MTDVFGPESPAISIERTPRAALAVADAYQEHALGAVIHLKPVACHRARSRRKLPARVQAAALPLVIEGIRDLAADKNIPLAPETVEVFAAMALDTLDASAIHGLTKGKADAAALAGSRINHILDVYAAVYAIRTILNLLGHDHLDSRQIGKHAQAWAEGMTIANDAPDRRCRWPDPFDMAAAYFKGRMAARSVVQLPEARIGRVAFMLDRTATASARSPDMPEPLMMRCPALPDLPGRKMPNGRLVRKLPDGTSSATWWRNGKQVEPPIDGGETNDA
jgi:hypothetical protein